MHVRQQGMWARAGRTLAALSLLLVLVAACVTGPADRTEASPSSGPRQSVPATTIETPTVQTSSPADSPPRVTPSSATEERLTAWLSSLWRFMFP